jgi:hypothetical protein
MSLIAEILGAYDYNSKPGHPFGLEKVARATGQIISARFFDGKITYPWDWVLETEANVHYPVTIPADPDAMKIKSPLDLMRAQLGGWREAMLIGLSEDSIEHAIAGWHYGFLDPEEKLHRTRIIFNPQEKIRVLVGDGPLIPVAKDATLNLWHTVEVYAGPFDRSDPKYRKYALI